MGVFIEPPFWAVRSGRRVAHAVSVVITAPTEEPITLEQGKLRAGLDWPTGDARDALMNGFIAAARHKVEQDTGLALLTQTRDIYYDAFPGDVITLPSQSTPLQSVTSVKFTDTAGVLNTLATDQYTIDLAGGRISVSQTGAWPSDLRTFQPVVIRIVSGWASAAALLAAAPLLVQAVGLLVGHFATFGRDVTSPEGLAEVPLGYREAIEPYMGVSLP